MCELVRDTDLFGGTALPDQIELAEGDGGVPGPERGERALVVVEDDFQGEDLALAGVAERL